jgi:phage virion morphogenesis protein
MSGAHITINDQEVRAKLADLLTQVKRPQRALRDIGEALLRSTDDRFRKEQAPDGTPWKQNSDVTLLRYLEGKGGLSKKTLKSGGRNLTQKGAKLLGQKKILRQSGALQDTIRYQLTGDGTGLELGTNRIYGAVMQFGAQMGEFGRYTQVWRYRTYAEGDFRKYAGTKQGFPIPWGHIPPRPYLGVSSADRQTILDILARHLNQTGP